MIYVHGHHSMSVIVVIGAQNSADYFLNSTKLILLFMFFNCHVCLLQYLKQDLKNSKQFIQVTSLCFYRSNNKFSVILF